MSLHLISITVSIVFMLTTLMAPFSFAEKPADIIKRQVLFGNPDKTCVTLSPDGRYIAYLTPKAGVLNLWVAPSDDIEKGRYVTQDTDRGIRRYFWSYNNKHLLYLQDHKGDENFRLYSYDFTQNKTQSLTPEKGVKVVIYKQSSQRPDELLIGLNDRDQRYFDVYLLDLINASKKLIMQNDKFINFIADEHLNIRFAEKVNEQGATEYFQFEEKNRWTFFMQVASEESMNTRCHGFDASGEILYWSDSRGRDTAAITAFNLKNKEIITVAEDQRADVGVVAVHPVTKRIQVAAVNYDKPTYKILDPSVAADIEYLQRINPGNLIINSRTLDDQTWLVCYDSDSAPVKYYKYDRRLQQAEFLFNDREKLANYTLSPMHPVVIPARDGLKLVSYLTLPVGRDLSAVTASQSPLPLVLYVHGGPWRRDTWGLDPTHQWLANRGYAVLSVNFRGSTGFGKHFINAGNRQWGNKMQDDLLDGVQWAITNKIADPKRIAIMGGSYGGYAALAGLTFTPDVFACGIDIVGPSNLVTLLETLPPYWQPAIEDFKKRVGSTDTEQERQLLEQISPLHSVARIKKPLLIAQGAHDPRVKQSESDQIVAAMQQQRIPVIYALYHDEGHGFAKPANSLSFYALVEQFLAYRLGGLAEPIGQDLQGANFSLNGQGNVNAREAKKMIRQATAAFKP